MAKDRFEFARITSPEEVAEYLTSLAEGLKRGEVSLESDDRKLALTPGHDVKISLRVKQKEAKGKIALEIGWKRGSTPKLADLHVSVAKRR
jgi:amphi-Trp domain-containing protein